MVIHYEESSDYGQDILDLVGLSVSLMYNKKSIGEIVYTLSKISTLCIDLMKTIWVAPNSYFEPQPEGF